jgi:hypothetical protein
MDNVKTKVFYTACGIAKGRKGRTPSTSLSRDLVGLCVELKRPSSSGLVSEKLGKFKAKVTAGNSPVALKDAHGFWAPVVLRPAQI